MGESALAEVVEVLSAPEDPKQCVDVMADALNATARALHDVAHRLRMSPDTVLARALRSSVTAIDSVNTAHFEIVYRVVDGAPWLALKGKTDAAQTEEVRFQIIWKDGKISFVPEGSIPG